LDEENTSPKVATIRMKFGELKLNLRTLNDFQKTYKSWIDVKILLYKIEEGAKIS